MPIEVTKDAIIEENGHYAFSLRNNQWQCGRCGNKAEMYNWTLKCTQELCRQAFDVPSKTLYRDRDTAPDSFSDPVNHPSHYTSHPSGIECIQITEHFSFCLGNAIKYLWRADLKNGIQDLEKAKWYIEREIKRRGGV